ncbi:MAG TPA: SRPBCC family protein [Xanthobacteraceae bacterium]|nr:SRPBCC family protein [Xanthobacteraceae bacterium]
MPQFSTKRRVRHGAADMFDLVADVERYPEFVAFCRSLKVQRRGRDERGRDTVVCQMTIAYKLIQETFTTRVTLDRAALQILVDYLSGPFHRLENRWSFRAAGERACDVEFYLHYEFRSRALAFVMGAMFEAVFRRFADAFERRADQIYAGRAQT